jgi:flagellar protein FlaG
MESVKLMGASNNQVNPHVRDSSATPSIPITGAGANRPPTPTTPATDSGSHPVKPTPVELTKAIAAANAALKSSSISLEYSQDKETGLKIVRVIDRNTKELIRQIPAEEMVSVARSIERFQGLLGDQVA